MDGCFGLNKIIFLWNIRLRGQRVEIDGVVLFFVRKVWVFAYNRANIGDPG